jgi:translation elongation factor EF-Tu-like GTPase
MSNAEFEPAQPQSPIWLIGHQGHGKKTLAAAIARYLSKIGLPPTGRFIEAGGAPSCPANTKVAILVVSAADGPMPQTRDHLKLAKGAGVPRIVIFMNKIDIADRDLASLIEMEMRELLNMCGFAGDKAAVIRGSAAKALGGDESELGEPSIERLMKALGRDGPIASEASSGGVGGFFRRLFE